MMGIAFFLSPEGDLIHVPDSHIGLVIRDPKRFGLTIEKIQGTYDRHREPLGLEGKARKEILLQIIAGGWIRLRRYRNRYWSVTAETLSSTVQDHLREWAEKMLLGTEGFKESDRYMPVNIVTSEGESHCTIGDLADGSW